MHGTEEASNGGRVRVRIIHGLNISHKELTYLLQYKSSKHKHYAHAPKGIDWQEKTIARPRPPLIRKTIKKIMLRLHHITVHHTCMLRDSQTLTQVFSNSQLLTSMTLISPSSCLKTIIRNQTSHSIQCTLYESFIISLLDAYHIRTIYNQSKLPCCLKTLKII